MAEATSFLSLPLTTATGTALTGTGISGFSSLSLPEVGGEALQGLAPYSALTLPLVDGFAFVEPIQTLPLIEAHGVAHAGETATSAQILALPVGVAQAATSAHITSAQILPALAGESFAVVQRLAASVQGMGLVEVDGSAITGRLGASTGQIPGFDGVAQAQTENPGAVVSALSLSALEATGTAITSRLAQSSAALPWFVAQAIAHAQTLAASGQTLPVWEADGYALASRNGVSTLTLPLVQAGANATTAHDAVSVLELPGIQAGQAQAGGALASSMLVLPVWMALGEAFTDVQTAGERKTYAVHAETFAQSRDEGVSFNSVARLGALLIGANENGLYLLGAYTDDGAPIHALAKFPAEDEAGAYLRRVESMVAGYRADGELRLTVETDDGDPQEYIMESLGGQECHPARVKIGKGMKGRYWRMTLENADGASFAIDKLDIDWLNLSRRTR